MSSMQEAEYQHHVAMWRRFTRLIVIGIVLVIVILGGMALTIL